MTIQYVLRQGGDELKKMKNGFPPLAEKTATILILGTMPGEESLRKNEYYAHPGNAFWRIMANLFGFQPSVDYAEKTRILLENRIAVWDVMKSCEREGSLDSRIKNDTIIENDFSSLFCKCPDIRNVYFNGARAEQEYSKRVLPQLPETKQDIQLDRLPSTSPAMARLSLDDKILAWSKIIKTAPSLCSVTCAENDVGKVECYGRSVQEY